MFISFEGIEGVGKTTAIQGVSQWLQSQKIDHIITREPGGSPVAEQIRALLLSNDHVESISSDTELLMMFAARAQHLEKTILPALTNQKWVLSDRFSDASFAYQCGARGLPEEKINLLNQNFVSRMPDLTFWLDMPVEQALARAAKRGALDRFEQEQKDFFTRAQATYLARQKLEPMRIIRIDARPAPDIVLSEILSHLK